MIHFPLNSSNEPSKLGASRAQADFAGLRDQIHTGNEIEVIVFDFAGIGQTNTSYIKNGPFWFFACGRLHARGEDSANPAGDPWHIRPLPVIPVVANIQPEVREAIDEVFYVRGAPCLEVVNWDQDGIQKAKLLGALESKLALSFRQFCTLGKEATAADLHSTFSADGDIGVTAWNNRLAELHELLLVTRRKQGKFWHYQTITEEIQDGRGPRA